MGYYGQRMALGLPVTLVSLVAALITAQFALSAAIWVFGVATYSGIVFGYAWIDERLFLFSERDHRSRLRILLTHACIVALLLEGPHLGAGSVVLRDHRETILWIGLLLLFAAAFAEIAWLAGRWPFAPSDRAGS